MEYHEYMRTSMTWNDFYSLKTVQSQFPIEFPDGRRWELFQGQCAGCNNILKDQNLRGLVSQPYSAYRSVPLSSMYVVDAQGYCARCNLMTSFFYRLHNDGGITGASPVTGEVERWEPSRVWTLRSAFRKLVCWLSGG